MLNYKGFELRQQHLFFVKPPKICSGVASTAGVMQSGMILSDENMKKGGDCKLL
jgi:hypothetical protein